MSSDDTGVFMKVASRMHDKFKDGSKAFDIINVSVGSKNPVKIAATKEGLEVHFWSSLSYPKASPSTLSSLICPAW